MLRLCIVEPTNHPAGGVLGRSLPHLDEFEIETLARVPDDLRGVNVVVLNNILGTPESMPAGRVMDYVRQGGGLFAIHDTVFPYSVHERFITDCGIRAAFDAVQVVPTANGVERHILLARAKPEDPLQRFPVRPMPEAAGHPILRGVGEFELAEEVWAQNLAAGVRPLMSAEVGDRIPAHSRFRNPIPVCACKSVGLGRLAFFSLGHFAAMYSDPQFLLLASNAIRWTAKVTSESRWAYDVFLSYGSRNRAQAQVIKDCGDRMGVRIFLDERELEGGDLWEEEIRSALEGSRELALLATKESLKSEWVTTEWGAAWVLRRRITPLLYRCDVDDLPRRMQRLQAMDWSNYEVYLTRVLERGGD
ncbi:TIR domain-containing protein [uncultured Paludibaculum sp.]|uniref:TIR domain-containing protein n=1 Tax=uncultured Paludibaculum sp. TaxID=1765020 RepID=UPI002AAB126E|nr:TIR domain-containing protein [uncultured Paludibaculum sp.]